MLQIYLQPAKPLLEDGVLLLIRTPLIPQFQPCLGEKELLGADSPSVACFLLTACYGPSVPRGLLG
jgi:hypothetical protein